MKTNLMPHIDKVSKNLDILKIKKVALSREKRVVSGTTAEVHLHFGHGLSAKQVNIHVIPGNHYFVL